MKKMIAADATAKLWSAPQWAKQLDCDRRTIRATKTWAKLREEFPLPNAYKDVNGQILAAIAEDKTRVGWSMRTWANHLCCSEGSILRTAAWAQIQQMRAEARGGAPSPHAPKDVNRRMLETIERNEAARKWRSREWATHLGCARISVLDSNAWNALREADEAASMKASGAVARLLEFPADMPVRDLVVLHYIPFSQSRLTGRRSGRGNQPLSKAAVGNLRKVADVLALWLRRDPCVADLVPESLEPLLSWLALAECVKGKASLKQCFMALCRFVGSVSYLGMRGRQPRQLSEEPDTLWGVCQQRYFPVSLRIRKHDTKRQYQTAIADFRDYLGREPKVPDLTLDNLSGMMKLMQGRDIEPTTINERRGRLVALWNWLARKRETPDFPTVPKLTEPRRIPKAWTQEQLERLFESCRQEPGEIIPGIAAADFWVGLHAVQWDSGERIGAILACTWDMIDVDNGCLEIPAEIRKGNSADMLHHLKPSTMAILARMRQAEFKTIFAWPFSEAKLYLDYTRILKRAGLPFDRKSKFHRMRKSVASHLQAAGVDACGVLGHSSQEVTRKSYLDPRIVVGDRTPANVLFNPSPEPPRLEYAEREASDASPEMAWI